MTEHDPIDHIDSLVAELGTDVPEMSDAAFDAGRGRLLAVLVPAQVPTAPEPHLAVARPRRRRLLRSPPRKLLVSAAAVVALIAGVFTVQAVRTDDVAPVASAAAQLNAAAARIDPTDEPIAPGQYRYVVWHSWELSNRMLTVDGDLDTQIRFLEERVVETWLPADNPEDCTKRYGNTGAYRWLAGDERRAKEAGVVPPALVGGEATKACEGAYGPSPIGGQLLDPPRGWWAGPSVEFLASLPRDPAQLLDRLRADTMHDRNPDYRALFLISATLLSGMVPADLRAALYQAIALFPGLEVTEQFANLDGQKGTAFGLSQAGTRLDVIVDPATGQFIGQRQVDEVGASDVPPGTALRYTSMTNPVVVDEVGATG